MKIVISIYQIDTLGGIPGHSLRSREHLYVGILVGKGDHAQLYAYVVPILVGGCRIAPIVVGAVDSPRN